MERQIFESLNLEIKLVKEFLDEQCGPIKSSFLYPRFSSKVNNYNHKW